MPHFVSFHLSDEAAINEVMMALVASLAAILFGQPDAVALKLIDCADMTPSPPITTMCSLISAVANFSHAACGSI
jgi:ABC-type uncharacterized transport system YnjBCD permease subunit